MVEEYSELRTKENYAAKVLGEKRFLIPVEAVKIYEDGVTVDQSREKASESLSLKTKVMPETAYERDF